MVNYQTPMNGLKITKKRMNNIIKKGNSFIILKYLDDLLFELFSKSFK